MADNQNVSIRTSLRQPNYLINSVDKTEHLLEKIRLTFFNFSQIFVSKMRENRSRFVPFNNSVNFFSLGPLELSCNYVKVFLQ